MKRNLRSLGVLALILAVAASVGTAAPVDCSTVAAGTPVLSLNAGGGCTLGGLVFNNFNVIQASGGIGTAEIDLISATFVNNHVLLALNPNLGTSTSGGTITDLNFFFTVSGGLIGASLNNTFSTNSSVDEVICNTNNANGCLVGNQVFNSLALSGQMSDCTGTTVTGNATTTVCGFGTGVPQVWVFKDISIGSPDTSHNTRFVEDFTVPEPMTMSLMGVGLLGLGILGRKLRK